MKRLAVFSMAALTAFACAISANAASIAQYNLGEDDAGAVAGNTGNDPTTAALGNDLVRLGDPTYSVDTPGGGSTLSMAFDGVGDYYYANAPTTDVSQDITLAFDAKGSNGASGFSFLASLGGNHGGIAVVEIGGNVTAFVPGVGAGDGGFDLDGDANWHHYELFWDADITTLTLSVDNTLVSTRVSALANGQIVDAFTIGGNFRGTSAIDAPVLGQAVAGDFEGSFNGLIDNVLVSQVPEPASLALMGLGGLMLLRRRRVV